MSLLGSGWGASLVGVAKTVPIMPLAPMLMFATLFGLSMDYQVCSLSRVREHHLRHGDPKLAIVTASAAADADADTDAHRRDLATP